VHTLPQMLQVPMVAVVLGFPDLGFQHDSS